MSLYEFFALVGAISVLGAMYIGYWTGWCWLWHWAWPSGPQWFIRPHVVSFLACCITSVIITLMILSKACDT